MRKDALLIYNLTAGKNDASRMLNTMIRTLSEEGLRVVCYPILPGKGAEEIIAAERGRFDVVVCCGGDGTLNHTVNALMALPKEERPLLGYVPAGSTNDFALSMDISRNVKKNCRRIATAEPLYYDVGRFNDRYFTYIAAFGAYTEVSYSTDQDLKNMLGHSAYIFEALRHSPFSSIYRMKAEAGGRTFEGEYLFCSVSDSTSVGGMRVPMFQTASSNDGRFEVTMIKRPPSIMEYQDLIQGLLIEGYKSPYLDFFTADSITFEFKDETPWTLDGEFGGKVRKASIEVIPSAIGLLR